MKKLNHKWLGPYLVENVISQNTYKLKLPLSFGHIHLVFSVTLLRPCHADTIAKHIQKDLPPLVIYDGVKEYKVEQILDSPVFRGKLEYLVCWKGYGIEEDKWRLAEDVQGSKQLISEFHCRNPEAPQHISTLDFTNLPFFPILNFTDTPDTVPSGWAAGCHVLGHCTFKGG